MARHPLATGFSMRVVLGFIAVLAALTFMGASAAMNWVFLSSLGKSHLEAQIFGAVSVAVDVLKSLLPLFIAWALGSKQRSYALLASAVFCLMFAFSLISAVGFAASNRGAVTGGREVIAARYQAAVRDVAEVEGKVAALPKARPQAVIVEALRALEQDRKWSTSKGCTEATASDSRVFCEGYFSTKAELASALEASRLDGRLGELRNEVARLRDVGAAQEVDVQATLLSRLTGFNVSAAQMGLVIFVAVLVEIAAAFGLYLAWGWLPHKVEAAPAPKAWGFASSPRESAADAVDVVEDATVAEILDPPPLRRLRLERAA